MSSITAEQIEALRDAAGAAGDYEQVAICERALELTMPPSRLAWEREYGDAPKADMTPEAAWAECERVIADAQGREVQS